MSRSSPLWRPMLTLIILLAFGLRIHQLDSMSFWLDEGLTPLRSAYSITEILSNRITIQQGVTKDTHPALHYLLIHFSRRLLGESDFAYRFPSALAGILLVPLLFQLSRRIDDFKVAIIAAVLAAVNPLQIWYAQEARMYTLLALLAAAATLALWRALTGHHLVRWLVLYVLFASLAIYTHYTAIFLIGAQGFFWVWLLWRRGYRRLLIVCAALGLLISLPLLPYTAPRFLTGAETGYFYVSPLIMLQDVVRGFGLGTVDFRQTSTKLLCLGAGLLLLIGLIGPQRLRKGQWLRRSFLLTYLMAAVVGLMFGSLIKPMYTGVRHIMVGSPAFLLLVSRSLASLKELERKLSPRRQTALLSLVGLAILLAGPAISLDNLYHNPGYAKDDMRALIQYVDQQAGGNDLILYNSSGIINNAATC
jgi:4-amino-4-deoxy-L-arabinose transferase-like glycosyltransferase